MEVYEKRGRWCVQNDLGRLEAKFATEKEAKEFLASKEPSCACELCECEPCECAKAVKDVEDVEPVTIVPKTDWNLTNDKGRS
tara:strand:- start:972 stop:1220 length:249 start_codon:yes stop_codon:yes gene_type:complete